MTKSYMDEDEADEEDEALHEDVELEEEDDDDESDLEKDTSGGKLSRAAPTALKVDKVVRVSHI